MDSVKIQHNVIKKAQTKEYFTLSLSGLFFLPYDNPNRKRDARCTNILHTGATLSGVGEGQRLRKGFRESALKAPWDRGRKLWSPMFLRRYHNFTGLLLESLSSAAEIRHIDEEYEVMRDSPLPCLNS